MSEDDDLRAAEHVLGLADESALEASDPAFAAAVDAWRMRMDPLLGPEREPPPHLWGRIERSLPANDAGRAATDPTRPWRFATFAASAVAAVLLGILVLRPGANVQTRAPAPQVASAEARMMVASLTSKGHPGTLSVSYNDRDGRMVVNPTGMDAGGKTAELWVIPPGGQPRSLGVIPDKAAATMVLAAERRALMAGGATLAVSLEPHGGSPTGLPTGPVVMTGVMSAV
ncbi:anti-sigma factor domain-containing protein [Sphingomonas tabacisoli]|uniref:Anti-sigma factor domain-containing protein n=1 Tax=Sphingomonas tabacisoli TaxID=2249466 RepID=A0ABW4I136_9SPHN